MVPLAGNRRYAETFFKDKILGFRHLACASSFPPRQVTLIFAHQQKGIGPREFPLPRDLTGTDPLVHSLPGVSRYTHYFIRVALSHVRRNRITAPAPLSSL